MSALHVFRSALTPTREVQRWRCKRCGMKRRRVYPVTSSFESFGFLRSFWLYQAAGSAVWTSYRGGCTGLRA